jgi:hypothetical protein
MAPACSSFRPEHVHPAEHPATALLAVLAIFFAMLLITWAAVEIHGMESLHSVVAADAEDGSETPALPRVDSRPEEERERDAAVTSSRWATGLSP